MQSYDVRESVIAILRALSISEIEYALDGSGDSGEATLDRIVHQDGSVSCTLPDVPVAISPTGDVRSLDAVLEGIVADAPEGDWVNNEGGYGTVTIRPFTDGEDDAVIDCDMTYRTEGGFDDDEDGFCDDDEFDEAEEPTVAAVVSNPGEGSK